jgi:hypothetical protein
MSTDMLTAARHKNTRSVTLMFAMSGIGKTTCAAANSKSIGLLQAMRNQRCLLSLIAPIRLIWKLQTPRSYVAMACRDDRLPLRKSDLQQAIEYGF